MREISELLEAAIERKVCSAAACGIVSLNSAPVTMYVGETSFFPSAEKVFFGTYFDLASLTKVFATTYVMARLVQRGIVSLNDTLGEFVYGVALSPHLRDITLAQILSHQSGLPAWMDFASFRDLRSLRAGSVALQTEILEKINRVEGIKNPGETTIYSDLGFIVLRFWLEVKTGKSFEDLVAETLRVIDPHLQVFLNPLRKGFSFRKIVATQIQPWRGVEPLQGEVHDENTFLLGGISGHAGLFGTLPACLTLGLEWLKGYYGKSTVFSQDICRGFSERKKARDHTQWATGWDVPSNKGSTAGDLISSLAVGHLGYTGTSIWLDLQRQTLAVLLCNRVHPQDMHKEEMRALRRQVYDSIWKQVGAAP